tara:strand:+ start:872 stop:1078 length:207 start_codon:yes stop_codon:yes gene_type:complete
MATSTVEFSTEELDIMIKLVEAKVGELQEEADSDSRNYGDDALNEFEGEFDLHRIVHDKLLRASFDGA